MGRPLLSRKRAEIVFAVALVAIYFSAPFLILPSLCSGTDPSELWETKFWCEANASDFAVGLFTLFLFIATYFLWRETARLAIGADDQAGKMERAIEESARAANAMEKVAVSATENARNAASVATTQREFWQRQMRAYVSVVVGGATYQDRDKKLKFAVYPKIINDGITPAYNVRTTSKAAIVQIPIDPAFDFLLPETGAQVAPAIGPHQFREVPVIVQDYVPDEDIAGIKNLSSGKGLFVWGRVAYEDAFGASHHATFAQTIFWNLDDTVRGSYDSRYNTSD